MRLVATVLFVTAIAVAHDGPCVELYDVSDLAQAAPTTGENAGEGIDIAEAIRVGVPGVKWGEEAEIRTNQGLLEVRAPKEVQERVRGVVESLRKNRETMIQVEAKLVEINLDHRAGVLRHAGVSVSKEGVDGTHCRAVLAPLTAQILLARIGHECKESKLLCSPLLTTFHAQRASITIASQTAYIQDYEIGAAWREEWDPNQQVTIPTAQEVVCDPLIGVFTDGLVLDLRAISTADGRMRLAGLAKTSSLLEMETLPISLPNGMDASIQMPHAAIEELAFNVELADGETLLLLGGVRGGDKVAMWLVTPKVVGK